MILASTSPYRRELLQRLGIEFDVRAPAVDESALEGETPSATAARLALAKARAVAADYPEAVVIGADQIAETAGQRLNKPGSHENAVAQLRQMSGRAVDFHSAMAVVRHAEDKVRATVVLTRVRMRSLGEDEIERYLRRERPYDCAGSAKVEGLGISLVESIDSEDPTALIGLPLVRLCGMLRDFGYRVP